MGKIHSLPPPLKDQTDTYIFISDVHSLQCDKEAIEAVLRFIDYVPIRQRRLILGGDILDFDFLHKDHPGYLKAINSHDWDGYFIPKVEEESIWWEEFYQKIEKKFPVGEMYFLEGNHSQRLRRDKFLSNVPYSYIHNFDLKNILGIESKRIRLFDYNDYLEIKIETDSIKFTHGEYCGANPIDKHIKTAHGSVVFGHVHSSERKQFKGLGKSITGISSGCLCKLDMAYLENRGSSWNHGFVVVNITENSISSSCVNIVNGKIYLSTGETI